MRYSSNLKILEIILDEKLLWNQHITTVLKLILSRLNLLKMVGRQTWDGNVTTMRQLYLQHIRPKVMYGCEVRGGATLTHLRKLEVIQNCSIHACFRCPKITLKG